MEQIFISEAQKDKLREMANQHPEPLALKRFAGCLQRQGLVEKVTAEGEKPAMHSLTEKGKKYLKETLNYPVEEKEQ